MPHASQDITRLLHAMNGGAPEAASELLALVYDQLHSIAHKQRIRWHGEHTLNTTALVHEAYLRLADGNDLDLDGRMHLMRVAAKAMRYVLLDHARAKQRQKRGGDQQRVDFEEALAVSEEQVERLISLDEALKRLEAHDARQSQIVECRFFAGMTIDETASVLDLSPATVKRGWKMARAWLYREMQAE